MSNVSLMERLEHAKSGKAEVYGDTLNPVGVIHMKKRTVLRSVENARQVELLVRVRKKLLVPHTVTMPETLDLDIALMPAGLCFTLGLARGELRRSDVVYLMGLFAGYPLLNRWDATPTETTLKHLEKYREIRKRASNIGKAFVYDLSPDIFQEAHNPFVSHKVFMAKLARGVIDVPLMERLEHAKSGVAGRK